MSDQRKSPFGVSNRTAAFNPPRAARPAAAKNTRPAGRSVGSSGMFANSSFTTTTAATPGSEFRTSYWKDWAKGKGPLTTGPKRKPAKPKAKPSAYKKPTSKVPAKALMYKAQTRPGDSVWAIASRTLGKGATNAQINAMMHKIIAANPRLKNPNLIKPGQWINWKG